MSKKGWIVILVVAALAVATGAWMFLSKREKPPSYRTAAVMRGDLTVQVTATGTLNPFVTVQVGTQVSGTVARLFADFNSRVKKGQVVALLDTLLLHAEVVDARANLLKAQAQMVLSTQTTLRTRALFAKGLVAQADLDQAVSDSAAAASALVSARAALDRAKVDLDYATIRSPITGVVINRAVDVGQTVAASFNTPTIFSIADDLSRMQVQASIDEADIGQVKVGQTATFTVDAYPARTFTGTVSQIRLQPATVQNVVSYTVMIDVDNKDMSLLPGMTANVTVVVQKAADVLMVPTAALKFFPPMGDAGKWRRHGAGRDSSAAGRQSAGAARDTGAQRQHAWAGGAVGMGDTTRHRQWKGAADENAGHVFVLAEGKPKFVRVKTGLSNGGFVEVDGALKPGDSVIVATISGDKSKTAAQPFGMGGAPGMGRRF
ncbi:MAG TPA: efflux RND transporter periplasmic adaptor subunit [Chitinivibrionales bacterium]|nr:efflux RND transporter periplasmic adaptor subunit [Chitinivibrionales bacterium]